MNILSIDRENCELVDPRDPARSLWRIRFRLQRRAPSNAWRSEFEAELARRAPRLTCTYLISPDLGIGRYRYRPARLLGRAWRRVRQRFHATRMFIDADVAPDSAQVQLAHHELLDIVRTTDENVRRNAEELKRAHIAREAALRSMGKAVAAIDGSETAPAEHRR